MGLPAKREARTLPVTPFDNSARESVYNARAGGSARILSSRAKANWQRLEQARRYDVGLGEISLTKESQAPNAT